MSAAPGYEEVDRERPDPLPRSPRALRRRAVRALLEELDTYPKPGLVSRVDSGSHDDMDASTFLRSASSLRRTFERLACAGRAGAAFETLRDVGIEGERRMLAATGGVNTHRGAIFVLGLLVAAAGAGDAPSSQLGAVIRERWASALRRHRPSNTSHGEIARARFAVDGVIEEAAAGMPTLFDVVLPAYRASRASGAPAESARVQAFFASMSTLSDTNLLHRGGRSGLADARREAGAFLRAGGVFAPDWKRRAIALHEAFRRRRLSPGGSADLLAACLFVVALDDPAP